MGIGLDDIRRKKCDSGSFASGLGVGYGDVHLERDAAVANDGFSIACGEALDDDLRHLTGEQIARALNRVGKVKKMSGDQLATERRNADRVGTIHIPSFSGAAGPGLGLLGPGEEASNPQFQIPLN